jgi:endonuclease/exonuclease/phosphatase family metal-dependent hydrolase
MTFERTDKIHHDLHPHFPDLLRFNSTKSLEDSALFQELKPKILQALNGFELASREESPPAEPFYRAVAWNVERGICYEEILHFLKNHPAMSKADILLLTEADLGMARSGNRNVARDLAEALGMNYFFAPSYLNLEKGSGTERDSEGENELGLHGNAILSRYPIHRPRIVPIPNSHDKMKGKEKRLGSQRALLATIDLAGRPLRVGCLHVNVRSTQKKRKEEVEAVVRAINEEAEAHALIGGDWNTSTYDSHSAVSSIVGFWVRVFVGVDRMMGKHYPHPERFFERKLFEMLEAEGFDYRDCNELGVCTNHYSIESLKQFKNLRDWLPLWCFRFIEWSLRNHNGKCSFKLDWFAQKGLKIPAPGEISSPRKGPSLPPKVIPNLIHNGIPASDHDAIAVDFKV